MAGIRTMAKTTLFRARQGVPGFDQQPAARQRERGPGMSAEGKGSVVLTLADGMSGGDGDGAGSLVHPS